MLYREIMAVCSQIHTKHINTVCGQNALSTKQTIIYTRHSILHQFPDWKSGEKYLMTRFVFRTRDQLFAILSIKQP